MYSLAAATFAAITASAGCCCWSFFFCEFIHPSRCVHYNANCWKGKWKRNARHGHWLSEQSFTFFFLIVQWMWYGAHVNRYSSVECWMQFYIFFKFFDQNNEPNSSMLLLPLFWNNREISLFFFFQLPKWFSKVKNFIFTIIDHASDKMLEWAPYVEITKRNITRNRWHDLFSWMLMLNI